VDLEFADEILLDEDEVTARLLETFSNPSYRPPKMPGVAMELMNLAQKLDVTFDEVVALLEQDAMLTGQVMRLMQSVVYSGQTRITSLKQALVRMGLRNLRDIVLEASLNMRVFRSDAYADTMERIRRHSTLVAHVSRVVCKYTSMEGEYAFICGLLHDVGVAGILIALSETAAKDAPPDLIAIWPAIDRIHPEAGVLMAKHWELPAEVQMVVGAHHKVLIDDFPHPLAATVCLAEDIAHQLGAGLVASDSDDPGGTTSLEATCLQSHTNVDRSRPRVLEHASQALCLGAAQLDLIKDEAAEIQENLG
jgi:HD-like signal output (HDOD) protein